MADISLELKKENFRLYELKDNELPNNTYVLCSKETRDILYNPHIAEKRLQDAMDKVSINFNEAINEILLKNVKISKVVEFILLAGGLYYNLNYGFKKVQNRALPTCFLGIKRQRIEGTEGEFRAVSTYENFESLVDDVTILIGDTIASGATIVRSIGDLENALREKNYKMENLVIISLACSTEGARKLKKLEEKIEGNLYLIVAEQLFHVMPDGTDLRFLKEDSIMPEESKEYTLEKYGEILGKEMKCAVFDWGTRCKNPKKHYEEFLEFAEEILKSNKLDEKGKKEIERMKKETKEELAKF